MSLSAEREKEIRDYPVPLHIPHGWPWEQFRGELLAELDRVRLAWQSDCDEAEDVEKERDQLREKLEKLLSRIDKVVSHKPVDEWTQTLREDAENS